MVKKLKAMADKKKASGSGLFDSALAGSVKESAQQIWLAGMGAFAKAQAEGKAGVRRPVKEGATLQKKTQSVAEEKLGDVTSKMTSMADDVTAKAGKHWDKLESIFEERTAKAMKKLGVPSSKDVQALMDRIDALSAQVGGASQVDGAHGEGCGQDRREEGPSSARCASRVPAPPRKPPPGATTRGRCGVLFLRPARPEDAAPSSFSWAGSARVLARKEPKQAGRHDEVAAELADRHVDEARPERQLQPAGDRAERIADNG